MVPVNKETFITVDAVEAGSGKVTCRIRSPNGADIDIDIIDKGDGTFTISFTPQFPGDYTIEIKFGGNLVPEGFYTVQVSDAEISLLPKELRMCWYCMFSVVLMRSTLHAGIWVL